MAMVIEYLTFEIGEDGRDEWLDVDDATWTAFLERQPGFVSKQIWIERGRETQLHAVICWRDEASWRAVPDDELAAVDRQMGLHRRRSSCRTFDVVRER